MDAREALAVVAAGKTLSRAEAEGAMGSIMAGEATPSQLGALLAALHMRGETPDEIAGFASALRANALRVVVDDGAIDVVGTGGDRSNSINISTISAIVVAGAGGHVAKHGNRAASSQCGSADVLEALGVRIDLGPAGVAACVREAGIGFMFAPRYHPAMRHAGPVRREIGIRTVFNILGPLANPAGVRRYLLGVPSAALGETVARALVELGVERALVVHGADGLDGISPSAETRTWEVTGTTVREGTLEPEALGLESAPRADIVGGDAGKNAAAARSVLDGTSGGARTAVLMNAGAACWVAGLADTVREGVDVASRAIDTGAARTALVRFAAKSQLIGAAESAAV
ncbi:MAG TPA: anthranilate phosphoribosyltransferase [Candidatus Limnocylindria bacterium]|nr:anthranilate phosphoribosyltransferase [Candidatus Limnocylindria bacterium]